ncbi:Mitochondrial intermediate peptidase [Coemansia brasiliensis]|uniref:mitochondrial intermediate peptidase n=1 Tax=Coemansia brasiliensis TaxID=2650707 RepID=A0A9W8II44_9FUNG|nr:Mitochondrial intermediate peptidase [Coemansia brasiliensis]
MGIVSRVQQRLTVRLRSVRTLSTAHEVARADDVQLRDLFDQATQGPGWFGQQTGLLMEERFASPQKFRQAGQDAQRTAESLVQRVMAGGPAAQTVKLLDQLSDTLCRVMDVAELVRQVHPDARWQEAAEAVYGDLLTYMNGLNTHVQLYKQLVAALDGPDARSLSVAARAAALSFRRDFERSGIHLPPTAHARFVTLSSRIHDWARAFVRSSPEPARVSVPIDSLRTLSAQATAALLQAHPVRRRSDGVAVIEIAPDDYTAHAILRDCTDPDVRAAVYSAWQRGAPTAEHALENMLQDRRELARLVGFDSFAHMALDDKMARAPAHVDGFLQTLATQARPRWDAAAQMLLKARQSAQPDLQGPLRPWDRDFWVARCAEPVGALPSLADYFSLGRVVLGLSRVFSRLFGVTLRAVEPQPGEVWHADVRKLNVVDEEGRVLGVVYCDVFARSSKAHVGAAHFTARCARRVDNDVCVESTPSGPTVVERDGMRLQLPVVVLICNFAPPASGAPPLLGWADVETIFHEMGHAVHSMLGQNGFHNVAGTRCSVDFVELPSVLMEHFARSPHALSLFAAHHKTGQPLPPDLLRQHAVRRHKFAAFDLHAQLFMSALDQRLHASEPLGATVPLNSGWSTQTLARLHAEPMFAGGPASSLLGYVENTAWQTRFSHLVGYGACYYSYLLDRVMAARIWNQVFGGDSPGHQSSVSPLNRRAGQRLHDELLRWGGGRDPWHCLASVLDNGSAPHSEIDAISRGDQKAMQIVGSWHLPDL